MAAAPAEPGQVCQHHLALAPWRDHQLIFCLPFHQTNLALAFPLASHVQCLASRVLCRQSASRPVGLSSRWPSAREQNLQAARNDNNYPRSACGSNGRVAQLRRAVRARTAGRGAIYKSVAGHLWGRLLLSIAIATNSVLTLGRREKIDLHRREWFTREEIWRIAGWPVTNC